MAIEDLEMIDRGRIRLKRGTSEIEVEARRADVDTLLERWWLSSDEQTADGNEENTEVLAKRSKL
jgi:hypothetical protein